MTQLEGPTTLEWAEKVNRITDVLRPYTTGMSDEDRDRIAEDVLVAIGDANV